MSNAHLFALYVKNFSEQKPVVNATFVLMDETLLHRIVHVLRMQVGDACILFDRKIYASVKITSIEKKRIVVSIQSIVSNPSNKAKITVLLPILKKESLEQALYALVECGVDAIVMVTTEKSQKKYAEHEHIRTEKILISAAEQSKNFKFPELSKPEPLNTVLNRYDSSEYRKVCAHPEGTTFFDFAQTVIDTGKEYVLIVGPEGDFSSSEISMLRQQSFELVALTPTILRSFQAIFLLAGAVRSLAYQRP